MCVRINLHRYHQPPADKAPNHARAASWPEKWPRCKQPVNELSRRCLQAIAGSAPYTNNKPWASNMAAARWHTKPNILNFTSEYRAPIEQQLNSVICHHASVINAMNQNILANQNEPKHSMQEAVTPHSELTVLGIFWLFCSFLLLFYYHYFYYEARFRLAVKHFTGFCFLYCGL